MAASFQPTTTSSGSSPARPAGEFGITRATSALPEMIESMKSRGGQIGGANPWGTQIAPSEVAETVLFLASDEAAAYTGTNLVIDRGGLLGQFPHLTPDPER